MRSLIAILTAAFIGLAFTPTSASARFGGGGFHGGGFHGGGLAGRGYGGRFYGHRHTAFYGPLIYDGYGGDECYWRGRRWVCTY